MSRGLMYHEIEIVCSDRAEHQARLKELPNEAGMPGSISNRTTL